ncbi:MAG TPA: deoxyribonuclease IV [Candidatus Dormibacteraeota bacterium]|jgi:deoxyribonuclease-4|nr:deoxyribonuclease IV [Candidatus Dormibacteraeota bacterium]
MLIGGHVSTRGGIDKSVDNAIAIGAEVIQTHPTPPQTWRRLTVDDVIVDSYRSKAYDAGLRGHFFHAVYLVNLASTSEALLKQSVGSLVFYMELADRIGADGVVFHPGSHKGAGFEPMLPTIAGAMRQVLDSTDSRAKLVVENSAGQGGCVGCSFDEVARIVDAVGSDRVAVCLDTAHAFANGYELRTAEGVDATLRAFDGTVGLDRLIAVHANDSRAEFESNVDRHANIGDGFIGSEGFRALLNDRRMRDLPFILEVPGEEKHGPDLVNVNRLRELAGLAPVTPPEGAVVGRR